MRTYVQLSLRRLESPIPDRTVENWLHTAGWCPQPVEIADNIKQALLNFDKVPKELQVPKSDTGPDHAISILSAIPRYEFERAHALATAKFIIRLSDTVNTSTVWGLVCVDETTVSVRWRHHSTSSLEHATERLIENVWDNAGPDRLFDFFKLNHPVPVREPLSTNDAYRGIVLGPRKARVAYAKEIRKFERLIGWSGLVVFGICTAAGWYFFMHSKSDEFKRWLSGAFDRFATAALATAAVSFLGYWFKRQELIETPVIKWE
jgi:hypothetical protein